jgi:hypothetical protein
VPELNNTQRARLLARSVVALLKRMGLREITLSGEELANLPDLGLVYDAKTDTLTFALGDDPS